MSKPKPIAASALVTGIVNAVELAREVQPGAEPGTFTVPSSSQPTPYVVRLRADSEGVNHLWCECPGHSFKMACKHVGAVAIHTDHRAARMLAEMAFADLEAFLARAHEFRVAVSS